MKNSTIKIRILDPVHCQIMDGRGVSLLRPFLKYEAVYYQKVGHRKIRKTYPKYLIEKNGLFLTGFRQHIDETSRQLNIPIEWIDNGNLLVECTQGKPELSGIIFRQDQHDLMQTAITKQRGVLQSPTGSGKTIVALGIMSCFPESKILFLCHTITLITQTVEELKKFGFKDIGTIGNGEKQWGRITVATVQSLVKISPAEYSDVDIIMVDEAHHISSFSGSYAKVLSSMLAPIRIGFTATMPYLEEAKLALEGFIGPKIGEVTVKELVDIGKLATPKIKLVSVPFSSTLGVILRYRNIYSAAIVQNKARNRLIVKEARDAAVVGKTVLVIVKEIAHGEMLVDMGKQLYGLPMEFIQGSTESEQRELIKKALNNKKVKCVIATAVWKEGVNIPALNTVVVAAGGKSEIATLQAIGRGLRSVDGKKEVRIIDFLDPYKYLAQHTVERLSLYVEQGWL